MKNYRLHQLAIHLSETTSMFYSAVVTQKSENQIAYIRVSENGEIMSNYHIAIDTKVMVLIIVNDITETRLNIESIDSSETGTVYNCGSVKIIDTEDDSSVEL